MEHRDLLQAEHQICKLWGFTYTPTADILNTGERERHAEKPEIRDSDMCRLYGNAACNERDRYERFFGGAAVYSGAERLYQYTDLLDYHRAVGGLPSVHAAH